jgi:hypothetical protein
VQYYYLVAGLPPLGLDAPVPFSSDDFLVSIETLVSRRDLEDLRHFIGGRPERARHSFAREWVAHETQLRNALARARGAARKTDPGPFLRGHEGFRMSVENAAAFAMAVENPLERERNLDDFRWRTLDEMVFRDRFGVSALFAFALRLRMAEKWARLTEEEGRQVVEDLVSKQVKSQGKGHA